MVNTYIKLNFGTIKWSMLFPTIIFLVTEAVYAVMLGVFRENSTFLFLSAALPIATGAYMAILLMYHSHMLYDQSVRMGRTRKETIPAILGYGLLFSALMAAYSELLVLVDILIVYKVWDAFVPNLFIFGNSLIIPIWGAVLIALGAPLVGFTLAALTHIFGRAALTAVWIFYILVVLFPGVSTPVINFIEINYILLPVAGIALFIWALLYFRKAPVKN